METIDAHLPFRTGVFTLTLPLACRRRETSDEDRHVIPARKEQDPHHSLEVDPGNKRGETIRVAAEVALQSRAENREVSHFHTDQPDAADKVKASRRDPESGAEHQSNVQVCPGRTNAYQFLQSTDLRTLQEKELRYQNLCARYDEFQRRLELHNAKMARFNDGCISLFTPTLGPTSQSRNDLPNHTTQRLAQMQLGNELHVEPECEPVLRVRTPPNGGSSPIWLPDHHPFDYYSPNQPIQYQDRRDAATFMQESYWQSPYEF
ncbi:uncharacterized protein EI97DRAFT_458871 [Westerdykella ornata]|uniref:Uncharacterized protein n=1 Tax=Westerdykella ornata TaxID=318751 RepID=A0A6A6JIT6_WESOR|nr:uncharacterized protein EI97DRAFT_458871 [Westerdykella ornata]KAF2275868.1 hypothetical protein EI97DRAFT_458871 [Westerdykella ornata]